MAFDRPMMAPRSGQHWLKSAQVHPKTTQERPVKFRKKTFQNYWVFTARVGRDRTGLERERRDDDYLRRGLANEKWSNIKTVCFHVQNEHPKTGFVEKPYEKNRNGRR